VADAGVSDGYRRLGPGVAVQLGPASTHDAGTREQVVKGGARQHAEQGEQPKAESPGAAAHERAVAGGGPDGKPISLPRRHQSAGSDDYGLPGVVAASLRADADWLDPRGDTHAGGTQRQQLAQRVGAGAQRPTVVGRGERPDQLNVVNFIAPVEPAGK